MNTLTWKLSTPAAQTPEYWLLFVDGNAWESLATPYTGPGQYSADLDTLAASIPPGTHTFSVALVGNNSMGPPAPAATLDYEPALSAGGVSSSGQAAAPSWPAADTVAGS